VGAVSRHRIAPALAQPAELVRGCLVESIAPLRLSEARRKAISRCEQVIGDAASSRDLRGQALGQRGLLYAKRWSIVEVEQDALAGIADITEGLVSTIPKRTRSNTLSTFGGSSIWRPVNTKKPPTISRRSWPKLRTTKPRAPD
jgi:hypothetical protein